MAAWGAAVASAPEAWVPFHAAKAAHVAADTEYHATPEVRMLDMVLGRGPVFAAGQAVRDTFAAYDDARHAATDARERAVGSYIADGLFTSASAPWRLFPTALDDYSPDLEGALTALLLGPVRP